MGKHRYLPALLASTIVSAGPSTSFAQEKAGNIAKSDILSGDAMDNGPVSKVTIKSAKPISADGVTGRAIGGGLIQHQDAPKSVSAVSTDYIEKQNVVTNTFQLLELTPGANSAGGDPYNMQYGGSGFSLRGLQSSQIGFTLEGAPLNSTYNYSVNPAEWPDNENLRTIRVAQGSPDLGSPSLNASGGVVNLFTRDPSSTSAEFADVSGGSYGFARGFARVDTGEIGNSGVTSFLSLSQEEANHTRGAGNDEKSHFDFAALKTFDDGSRTKLTISFSDVNIENYLYPTLKEFQLNGRSNNYSSVFTGSNTNYYKLQSNPYDSLLVSLPSTYVASPNLSIDFTPYTYYFYGTTGFGADQSDSSIYSGTYHFAEDLNPPGITSNSTVVYTPYIEETSRSGFETSASYTAGVHTFLVGQWFQYENDNLFSEDGKVTDGVPDDSWGDEDLYQAPNGQPIYNLADHSYVTTNAIFAGDTINLFEDRLRIDLGMREAMITRNGSNLLPGTQYKTGLNASEPLPIVGARLKVGRYGEVFVSGSTAFRLPAASAIFENVYGGQVTGVANSAVKPEYSILEELGYRYQSPFIIGSATLFNYNFTNRLISTEVYRGSLEYSTTINGGGQSAQGVDLEVGTAPFHHLRPYVSGEYLHATIDNNLQSGADYLPTAGKTAVESPNLQFGLGLDYDDGRLFGNAEIKWVDSQYTTFMNDESIPAYVVADMTAGVRLPNIGIMRHPELRLNLVNVADKNYLSGAYSVTTNANSTRGIYGTTIAGSSPTYFIGTPFIAMLTLSSGFRGF